MDAAIQQRAPDNLSVEVQGSAHDPRTAVIRLLQNGELSAQRSFSPGPPRCADFTDALALAIAMMLRNVDEPVAELPVVSEPEVPSPEPHVEAQAAETGRPKLPLEPTRAPRSSRIIGHERDAPALPRERLVSARAAGVLAKHVGASTAGGVRVELSLGRGHGFALRAGMLALFSSTQTLSDGAGRVRYLTRPLAASLLGCAPLLDRPAWLIHACVGLLAGGLVVRGRAGQGVRALPSDTLPWVALQAELGLARRLGATSWLFLSASPIYGTRQLGVSAAVVGSASPEQERLPRLGASFAIGLSFDFVRQGSPTGRHE